MVYITLSQPCTADLILVRIINKIIILHLLIIVVVHVDNYPTENQIIITTSMTAMVK